MAISMPRLMVQSSPSNTTTAASLFGYSRMALAVSSLAEYIRTMGYVAIPAMNGTGLTVPMAVDAGLGECGRHGLLITPEFGSNVRLCKVLTNMPLVPDKPLNFGMEKFCKTCMKCARQCPPGCITKDGKSWGGQYEVNNPGVKKWYNDYKKCLNYWIRNGSACMNCIAVCPFTKGKMWIHGLTGWFIKNIPLLNRFWLILDDLFGYGEERDSRNIWEKPVGTYGLDPDKYKKNLFYPDQ